MRSSFTENADRFELSGTVEVQNGRAMVGGYDPARILAECFGKAKVETCGGGEKEATEAEVYVRFK